MIRQRIRTWLIDLANRIGGKDHYDFGEPIVGISTYKNFLIAATKHSVWSTTGKKWLRIKRTRQTK